MAKDEEGGELLVAEETDRLFLAHFLDACQAYSSMVAACYHHIGFFIVAPEAGVLAMLLVLKPPEIPITFVVKAVHPQLGQEAIDHEVPSLIDILIGNRDLIQRRLIGAESPDAFEPYVVHSSQDPYHQDIHYAEEDPILVWSLVSLLTFVAGD